MEVMGLILLLLELILAFVCCVVVCAGVSCLIVGLIVYVLFANEIAPTNDNEEV